MSLYDELKWRGLVYDATEGTQPGGGLRHQRRTALAVGRRHRPRLGVEMPTAHREVSRADGQNDTLRPGHHHQLRMEGAAVTGDGDVEHEPVGPIAYWNRYVGVTQMGGHGTFADERLNLTRTNGPDDRITLILPALQEYQLSLKAPKPPTGSFNVDAATRGKTVFEGAGQCASCHTGTLFTDANTRLHPKLDSMAEPETPSYADRSATKQYRTSPLAGLWQHPPYFHDGSAATLADVVNLYNTRRSLGLSDAQKADLVEYLKSL